MISELQNDFNSNFTDDRLIEGDNDLLTLDEDTVLSNEEIQMVMDNISVLLLKFCWLINKRRFCNFTTYSLSKKIKNFMMIWVPWLMKWGVHLLITFLVKEFILYCKCCKVFILSLQKHRRTSYGNFEVARNIYIKNFATSKLCFLFHVSLW